MKTGDAQYRRLLHRYNQLELQRGMTDLERLEYVRIGHLLTLAEMVSGYEQKERQREQHPNR